MEIKRHSNKVYKIYAKEKESRQSHYIRQSRAEEEGMKEGWDGQQTKETSGGESKKQRGRSEPSAPYEHIRQQQQQLFTMWGSRRIQVKISNPADTSHLWKSSSAVQGIQVRPSTVDL